MDASASVDVLVSAEAAFAFVADASNNPRWQSGQVSCLWEGDEPPIHVGSRYRQHARFLGRDVRSVFEVTEYDEEGPTLLIAARTLDEDEGGVPGGFPITFRRIVAPLRDRTCRVTTFVTGEPGRFFTVLGPFLGWLMRRSIAADYRRLKDLLEV